MGAEVNGGQFGPRNGNFSWEKHGNVHKNTKDWSLCFRNLQTNPINYSFFHMNRGLDIHKDQLFFCEDQDIEPDPKKGWGLDCQKRAAQCG